AGGTWNLTTLYAFMGQPDAGFPYGGLIADVHGTLYGTTYFGGANGAGTVFKVGPSPNALSGWRDVVLYSFQGGADGGNPTSTLLFDGAGNLYGTTSAGGDPGCDCGVAFEVSPSGGSWNESVLHTFGTSPDGANPYYGLTPDGMGNLFGTTASGGRHSQGVVFELTP
ncbi:MAG: choice-of-anchor tandem repeat GloVer-containing protein, partial [Candidatus Korobacteraceae bacterium]